MRWLESHSIVCHQDSSINGSSIQKTQYLRSIFKHPIVSCLLSPQVSLIISTPKKSVTSLSSIFPATSRHFFIISKRPPILLFLTSWKISFAHFQVQAKLLQLLRISVCNCLVLLWRNLSIRKAITHWFYLINTNNYFAKSSRVSIAPIISRTAWKSKVVQVF